MPQERATFGHKIGVGPDRGPDKTELQIRPNWVELGPDSADAAPMVVETVGNLGSHWSPTSIPTRGVAQIIPLGQRRPGSARNQAMVAWKRPKLGDEFAAIGVAPSSMMRRLR